MAPVVFKIKFYSNKNRTMEKNVAHINYIATRPGVDKNEKINTELEEIDLDNAESHVGYITSRPRSHGLFDDKDRVVNLNDVKNELKEHKGIVWRSVLSLKEKDAIRLGYVDRQQWEEVLRSYMPDAAKKLGIEEPNLRWVAAFHQEKGHPHCHIMFWEKSPKRTRGKLGEWELKQMKKTFVKGLYEKERSRLYAEKTATRDLIRDLAKDDLSKVVGLIREIRKGDVDVKILEGENKSVVQKLWTDKEKDLSERIIKLADIMPGRGKIALKYMPEEVKKEAQGISKWILSQPGFNRNVDIIKHDAVELARQYTYDLNLLVKARDNAYTDIKNRVSQLVLKAAVESRLNNNISIDKERSEKAVNLIKDVRIEKIKNIGEETLKTMVKILSYSDINRDETISIIMKFKEKIALDGSNKDLNKIINQSYDEYTESIKWGRIQRVSNEDWNNLFKNLGYKENEVPKNIFLNDYEKKQYINISNSNIANKVWKAVWRAIEKEKYIEEIKAERVRKKLNRRNKDRNNYNER